MTRGLGNPSYYRGYDYTGMGPFDPTFSAMNGIDLYTPLYEAVNMSIPRQPYDKMQDQLNTVGNYVGYQGPATDNLLDMVDNHIGLDFQYSPTGMKPADPNYTATSRLGLLEMIGNAVPQQPQQEPPWMTYDDSKLGYFDPSFGELQELNLNGLINFVASLFPGTNPNYTATSDLGFYETLNNVNQMLPQSTPNYTATQDLGLYDSLNTASAGLPQGDPNYTATRDLNLYGLLNTVTGYYPEANPGYTATQDLNLYGMLDTVTSFYPPPNPNFTATSELGLDSMLGYVSGLINPPANKASATEGLGIDAVYSLF